jgi:hypothetical protein
MTSSSSAAPPDAPAAHTPGCRNADTCPAQGRGHWLRHVDKNGERTTKIENDGTFWNRSCPVPTCTMKVYG